MSYCNITCTCGHTADIEEFTHTPLGEIPDRRTPREVLRGSRGASFQCPACRKAWHIEKTPLHMSKWTDRQGREHTSFISEPNKIVLENSFL